MAKNSGVHPGWGYAGNYTPTTSSIVSVPRDPTYGVDEFPDQTGVMLRRPPGVNGEAVPITDIYPAGEPGEWTARRIAYLRQIAKHRRRIQKELERRKNRSSAVEDEPKLTQTELSARYRNLPLDRRPSVPLPRIFGMVIGKKGRKYARTWESLRLVDCTGCGTRLLASCEEHCRDRLIEAIRKHQKGKGAGKGCAFRRRMYQLWLDRLPPPIARTLIDGRCVGSCCVRRVPKDLLVG